MEADWYVDPLGRYDGRFFDGESWTDRVSDGGVLTIDPTWPLSETLSATDEGSFEGGRAPAIEQVGQESGRRADSGAESPVRTVAVLDESLVQSRTVTTPETNAAVSNGVAPGHDARALGLDGKYGVAAETAKPSPRRRWPWLLAFLGLLAAAVAMFVVITRSDDAQLAEPEVVLDASEEDRVADLQSSGVADDIDPEDLEDLDSVVPESPVDPGETFAPSELVEVGELRVRNGESVLADLTEWHQEAAADRGVDLVAGSGCWFARIADAAVSSVACGPVGGSAASEFLFDLVPLRFEDIADGQLARPGVDAAQLDEVLSPTIELVGAASSPPPPQPSTRGDRNGG